MNAPLRTLTWTLALALPLVACKQEDLPPNASIIGPDAVMVGEFVQLDGEASDDPEGNRLIYLWSFDGLPLGSETAFNEPAAKNPSFLADVEGEYVVALTVDDGLVYSVPITHTVVATQGNRLPTADAGLDRAASLRSAVVLDGSGSFDPDGDTLTYAWSLVAQPDGGAGVLDDATTVLPTFTAAQEGTYTWALVVSDGSLDSSADQVSIRVHADNLAPVAAAGVDQLADVGEAVALDGTASADPNGDPLTYQWSFAERPAGSLAALDTPVSAAPTFTADVAGTYRVQLRVSDGTRFSGIDEVVVTATTPGTQPPVADAGADQGVVAPTTVQLDGSASSDPENAPLSHAWTLVQIPAGSAAALNDPAVVGPSFVADQPGTYVAHLMVSDGVRSAGPDEVVITATGGNTAPTADSGPDQAVAAGALVALDGSGSSDPEGDLLSYQWHLEQVPAGSTAFLNIDTLVNPSFVADVAGTYAIRLVVSDGQYTSASDAVAVQAAVSNVPPVADAGADQAVGTGAVVGLDGAASTDADGDALAYDWALESAPAGSTAALNNPALITPSFTADVAGDYRVRLRVSDGQLWSPTTRVTVTASGGNLPPLADAGADQAASTGNLVGLDASASSDPESAPLTYQWSFASVPAGATAQLNYVTAVDPSFVPDRDGAWVLRLEVSDGQDTGSDTVLITTTGANLPPVADAGPDLVVVEGNPVQLDGSASTDPDGDELSYHWWFHQVPLGFFGTFNYDDVVGPSFLADAPGTVVARLQVNDGTDVSTIDEVVVTILEAFKVVAYTPDDNAVGVSLTTPVTVTFNQDADPLSLTESTFWVNPGPVADFSTRVPAVITYDPTTFVATLSPVVPLDPQTVYTATVTTAVLNTTAEPLNREYTWQFETRRANILFGTDPDDGDIDVPVTTWICALFIDDVDTATVDATSFSATFPDRWGRTEPISGSYAFFGVDPQTGAPSAAFTSNYACLVPAVDEYDCAFDRELLYFTDYTVTITTDVALLNGDSLLADEVYGFQTTTEPFLIDQSPWDAETDVPIVVSPLWAEFDRAMDPATVDGSTVLVEETLSGLAVPGVAQLGADGFTVEFFPSAWLAYDTEYTVTLVAGRSGLLDLEGDYLMDDLSWSFRTSPPNRAVISPNDLANNAASQSDFISIFFERLIDVTTLDETTVIVENLSDSTVMNATRAWDPATRSVSLVTFPELSGGDYRVTITRELLDHLGNPHPFVDVQTFNVSGNSNTGPGVSIGQDIAKGHLRFFVDANDNVAVSSVTPDAVVFTDGAGLRVPYELVDYEFSPTVSDRIWMRPLDYLTAADGPYTVTVTSLFTDASRNASGGGSGGITVETVSPTVALAMPAGPGIPGGAVVTIRFDERIDESTLVSPNLRLLDAGLEVPGTGTVTANGMGWRFEPAAYLDAGVSYTIDVTAGVTDTAGNPAVPFQQVFTIETGAPSVVSITPIDTATGVATDTDVVVVFDEPMDERTVVGSVVGTPGTLRLTDTAASTEGFVCIDVQGDTVTVDPVDDLAATTVHQVDVDAAITDRAGNGLTAPFASTFETN